MGKEVNEMGNSNKQARCTPDKDNDTGKGMERAQRTARERSLGAAEPAQSSFREVLTSSLQC